jgi:hypothetical protein
MKYLGYVAPMEVEILVGNFKLAMLKDGDHFGYLFIHALVILMLYYV